VRLETATEPGCGECSWETRLEISLHLAILPVKREMLEAFAHQCVYAAALWSALRVYARKHVTTMSELQSSKLLIQSAFTLANRTKGPVYRQLPIWG
jgi:hypothetical protein